MMILTLNEISNIIQQNTLLLFAVDGIKAIGTEYILNLYHKSKGRTVDEEMLLCLEYSLEIFTKSYELEYTDSMIVNMYEKLGYALELNDDSWKEILESVTGLQFNKQDVEYWIHCIVKAISEKRLVVLRDYLEGMRHKNFQEAKIYPRILTTKPSLPPEEYVERCEYDEILKKIQNSRKLVLVNGLGGIGKSTVCRKIFHQFDGEAQRTLAWVTYHDKNLLEDLRKQLFFPKGSDDWKNQFLQFLQQDIEDTAVIFVDNINVTEEEEPFLQELSNAKCSVICTSRITGFSHYDTVPIDFLSTDACIRLFYKYYGLEYDDAKIRRIVKRAGKHTLVIEILAKISKSERYTLTDLENMLEERGFDLEGIASIELREDNLIGHLLHTFNTEKLNQQQKRILYCMSLLPSERIPYKFKIWMELSNSYNLNYLERHAWFIADNQGYYMHPVIKEVVRRAIIPQTDAAEMLLKNLTKEISYTENPDHELSMRLISFIEAVIETVPLLLENVPVGILAEAYYNISVLYGQFKDYTKALSDVQKCICLIKSQEKQGELKELLGSAYNHKGYIYYYDYKDSLAEKSYLNAYKIRKELKKKKSLVETESNLALLYQGMWKAEKDEMKKNTYLQSAEKYQKNALRGFQSIFRGKDHSNMASAYNNMAVIMNSAGKNEAAVFYYNKAAEIRCRLNNTSRGDLSVTYLGLGNTFYDMAIQRTNRLYCLHDLKMAKLYLKMAKEIRVAEIRNGNQKWSLDEIEVMNVKIKEKIKLFTD